MNLNKRLKISIIAVLVISAIALIIAYFYSFSKSDEVNVRLKWIHQAQFAGFYYAEKAGFYKNEGIKVKLNPGGVDFPSIKMVASGSEQFGVTGADQVILARSKGIPVVAIAIIYRKSPMVFFSLKESNITKPQDFIGKNVGVKYGGNEELTYRALLNKLKINKDSINEIPVKYDMSPLFSKQIDVWPGYSINEPIIAKEKGYEVNIIWPSDYGINMYADAIFTTESMIKKHPKLVKRFLLATIKGWNAAYNNPEKAVSFTLQYSNSLKRKHELAMMKSSLILLKPDNKPIGSMEDKIWKEMQELLLNQGFIKKRININKAYNSKFIEEVNYELEN